jgi:hypothetical protein
MTLKIPDLCQPFIETVGCCWRVNADEFQDLDAMKGAVIAPIEGSGFCRQSIEKDRPRSRYGKTVHVHIEVATLQYFRNSPPTTSGTIEQIDQKLGRALGGRQLLYPTYTIEFKIPVDQIAVGSALGAVVGFQTELEEHRALLTQGKLEVTRDKESLPDYLTFRLNEGTEKMSFDITVQCIGRSMYLPDCLESAVIRGSEVFNKMVLAK